MFLCQVSIEMHVLGICVEITENYNKAGVLCWNCYKIALEDLGVNGKLTFFFFFRKV